MSPDRNLLVQQYLRLAGGIATALWLLGPARRLGTLDDAIQEARHALVEAADRFRPELGNRFSTYAVPYVRGKLLSAIRRNRASAQLDFDGTVPDREPCPLREDEEREHLHDALRCLTRKERLVITERFGLESREPKTLEAVGAQLGITKERVRQLESRALGRLRERLQPA